MSTFREEAEDSSQTKNPTPSRGQLLRKEPETPTQEQAQTKAKLDQHGWKSRHAGKALLPIPQYTKHDQNPHNEPSTGSQTAQQRASARWVPNAGKHQDD